MSRINSALLWLIAACAAALPINAQAGGPPPGAKSAPVAASALPEGIPQARVEQPKVTATLFADHHQLIPGQSVRVGLQLDFAPGHYIYWRGPAATITDDITTTGTPTEFSVVVPAGFEASTQPWPLPARVEKALSDKQREDLFIYKEHVLLDAVVRVPDTLSPSAPLTAKAQWLLCEKTCQPGEVEVTLTLPTAAAGEPQTPPNPAWSAPFEAADTARPLATLPPGYTLDVQPSSSTAHANDRMSLLLTLTPPAGLRLTAPEAEHLTPALMERASDSLHARRPTHTTLENGSLQVTLPLFADEFTEDSAAPITLNGLMVAQVEGDKNKTLAVPFKTQINTSSAPNPSPNHALGSDDTAAATSEATAMTPLDAPAREKIPLWQALVFALLGGLILNIMPCVLPVLSLKSLALVELAKETQSGVQKHVAAYTLGVLSSFWVLAGVIIALQQSGEAVGWGFQFQNPAFVTLIVGVVFAASLSLFGVFELPGLSIEVGGQSEHKKDGLATSFSHGLLATVLSTPCSAPLLGGALAFALTQPPAIILLVMTMVGIGLASPVVMLAVVPKSRKLLPRPGLWMNTFKQVVGFLMVATCVWLLDVLAVLVSAQALIGVLVLLAAIAFGGWIWGSFGGPLSSTVKKSVAGLAAVALIVGASWRLSLDEHAAQGVSLESDHIAWMPFKGDETVALVNQGQTIFIDFTAEWCLSCKAFESTVIETDAVSERIRANNVLSFKADWTRKDPIVTKWLNHFGGVAVPLYVVMPAGKPQSAIIMADSITQSELLRALDAAGPSIKPLPVELAPAISSGPCLKGKTC